MLHFPELREALRSWVSESSKRLSGAQVNACALVPTWARDSDGLFRLRARRERQWDDVVRSLEQLPAWNGVLAAVEQNSELSRQLGIV
jgi:hypothetical protein